MKKDITRLLIEEGYMEINIGWLKTQEKNYQKH